MLGQAWASPHSPHRDSGCCPDPQLLKRPSPVWHTQASGLQGPGLQGTVQDLRLEHGCYPGKHTETRKQRSNDRSCLFGLRLGPRARNSSPPPHTPPPSSRFPGRWASPTLSRYSLGPLTPANPTSHFNKAWLDQYWFCAYHPQSRNEAAWKKLPGDRPLPAASYGPMTKASCGLMGP